MRLLDLTLASPAENLALDEALLDEAEAAGAPCERLRLWEPSSPIVVVGRSSRIGVEVRQDRCRELGVPILRRSSGGAAIVTGPGCLMYAVVLSLKLRPSLRAIDAAHRFVLDAMAAALRGEGFAVERSGTSDLTLDDRKFSGNSLRVRREHLLYHGTLLYDFDLKLVSACLGSAPRQPSYRAGRSHDSFIRNLPIEIETLRRLVADAWCAETIENDWPRQRVAKLVAEKYSRREWTYRH